MSTELFPLKNRVALVTGGSRGIGNYVVGATLVVDGGVSDARG